MRVQKNEMRLRTEINQKKINCFSFFFQKETRTATTNVGGNFNVIDLIEKHLFNLLTVMYPLIMINLLLIYCYYYLFVRK